MAKCTDISLCSTVCMLWGCGNPVSLCIVQIPQFLLDECSRNGDPCRIFCTQPRRLAAIAVAERVAAERGESVGQTVGYHIRLESRWIGSQHFYLNASCVRHLCLQQQNKSEQHTDAVVTSCLSNTYSVSCFRTTTACLCSLMKKCRDQIMKKGHQWYQLSNRDGLPWVKAKKWTHRLFPI